ncbi:MAG: hypothetical protein ACOYLQ_19670 [Hyphomicrobiaceae bacterium]
MGYAWSDIKSVAEILFRVWTSGGDLTFAKEAWSHLDAAGLCDDSSIVSQTRAVLRLLTLRQFYGEFCAAKWQEGDGDELLYLVSDIDEHVSMLALGVLAASHLSADDLKIDDESDLKDSAIIVVVMQLSDETLQCLKRAYGGTKGLYDRLSRTASDDEETSLWDEEPSNENQSAYEVVEVGGRY